jgi:hypothetical protein
MNRALIELLRLAGLLGCGLSLAALLLAVSFRIEFVRQQPAAGLDTRIGVLHVLDAFKEPGTTFLLSSLLYVVCGLALKSAKTIEASCETE